MDLLARLWLAGPGLAATADALEAMLRSLRRALRSAMLARRWASKSETGSDLAMMARLYGNSCGDDGRRYWAYEGEGVGDS